MNAQRHERFVVDLHRYAGATNGARNGQIGALPQQTRVEQRDDLAVHRRDAQ
jgi:succinylglutamate desuccinylase